MDETEQKVRDLLADTLPLTRKSSVITSTEDLQYCGMDSLNCIQLIIALEESFNIQVPDERLGMENVRNIRDICKLVREAMKDG